MPANPAGTRIVQNELEHPGPGLPVASGRTVTAKLNGPGFIDGGTREKVFTREAVIDPATGLFQLILEVNADIDPAGTSWIVKEPGNRTWTIQVPAGDPTVPVTLRACLVADPTNPNPIQAGVSEAELQAFEEYVSVTYARLNAVPDAYLRGALTDGDVVISLASNWGITSGGVPYFDPDGAAAGEAAMPTINPNGSVELRRLSATPALDAGGSGGSAIQVAGPTLPSLPAGTEFVWFETDGAGTLLDILSGVA